MNQFEDQLLYSSTSEWWGYQACIKIIQIDQKEVRRIKAQKIVGRNIQQMLSKLRSKLGLAPFSFWNLFLRTNDQTSLPLTRSQSVELFPKHVLHQIRRCNSMDSTKKSTEKKSKGSAIIPEILDEKIEEMQNKETLSVKADKGDTSFIESSIPESPVINMIREQNMMEEEEPIQEEKEHHQEYGMVTPPRKPITLEMEEELLKPPKKSYYMSESSDISPTKLESSLLLSPLLFESQLFSYQQPVNNVSMNFINTPFTSCLSCLQSSTNELSAEQRTENSKIESERSQMKSTIPKSFPSALRKSQNPRPKHTFTRLCAVCGQYARFDYTIQACSHRVHNLCKSERQIKRNEFKCALCQRKKPQKIP